jgi:hypothetical protein
MIRLDPLLTQAQVRELLAREAEAAWGAARLAELASALDAAAAALWELAQHPLEPRDDEPDFIYRSD